MWTPAPGLLGLTTKPIARRVEHRRHQEATWPGSRGKAERACTALSTSARWLTSTPFGVPVVPPVYMRRQGSSSSGSKRAPPPRRPSQAGLVAEVVGGSPMGSPMSTTFDAGLGPHLVDHAGEEEVDEHDLGAGVVASTNASSWGEAQVERVQHDRPEVGGVVQLHERGAVRRHHRHPVAPLDAQLRRRRRRQPAEHPQGWWA